MDVIYDSPIVYAVKHKDINTRIASRSGGIFSALSDKVLDSSGVVYGCILTDDFKAVHGRAKSKLERNKMRDSKYTQSNLGNVFRTVKLDVEEGKHVLFSGTSCQIAGLRDFLGKQYSNLLCVDIVCHGSPFVWQKYLHWQELKAKSKCISVDFRNKKDFGWADHIETLAFEDGKKSIVKFLPPSFIHITFYVRRVTSVHIKV